MTDRPVQPREPKKKDGLTSAADRYYTRFAGVYDVAVKLLPVWKTWLQQAIPHIRGDRVLEVSFGTGYLMTQYAAKFETYGIDYNRVMVATARKNLARAGVAANLQRASVEALPYKDASFDSVVNTMAFSGYPDAEKAMAEIHRVLREGGRLILIDVNYPSDGNWLGTTMIRFWKFAGDIIRQMDELFREFGFDFTDEDIGGRGSVHLYVANKRRQPMPTGSRSAGGGILNIL